MTRTVTCKNNGCEDLAITGREFSPMLSGTNEFAIVGPNTFTVAPGATVDFDLTFQPRRYNTSRSGFFYVYSDDVDTLGDCRWKAGRNCVEHVISAAAAEPDPTDQDIHIKQNWSKVGDIDLHLVRPGGSFNDRMALGVSCPSSTGATVGTDCFYGNACPDWGVTGDYLDDPYLDIDNVDGGPGSEENINLAGAVSGVYTVYSYFYAQKGATNVGVDITIYLAGVQVDVYHETLPSGQDNWLVCTIDWDATSGTGTLTYDGRINPATIPPPPPKPY
jgi:hypothetical protein